MADTITLTAGGQSYDGWTSIRVSRGITRLAADFDISVTDRWVNGAIYRPLKPFDTITLSVGRDKLLTGYIDSFLPSMSAAQHDIRITGRSRTEDLIDCTPDIEGGQFPGGSLASIARAICKLFGIGVVVVAPAANLQAINPTIERCETAFSFLRRLGDSVGVLLTDDAAGNLVLTTAGSTRATGRLAQGQNIEKASATLTSARRFSDYIVKGQNAAPGAATTLQSVAGAVPAGDGPAIVVGTHATAHDPYVPRYRPHVELADSAMDAARMQQRVNWQRNYAAGHSIQVQITVPGWRQPDGTLWQPNQLVSVTAPWLGIDQELLIIEVAHLLAEGTGTTTELTVSPVEGYTPDPGAIKYHKPAGGKGGGGATTLQALAK